MYAFYLKYCSAWKQRALYDARTDAQQQHAGHVQPKSLRSNVQPGHGAAPAVSLWSQLRPKVFFKMAVRWFTRNCAFLTHTFLSPGSWATDDNIQCPLSCESKEAMAAGHQVRVRWLPSVDGYSGPGRRTLALVGIFFPKLRARAATSQAGTQRQHPASFWGTASCTLQMWLTWSSWMPGPPEHQLPSLPSFCLGERPMQW